MRDLGLRVHQRVQGRAALERRLRGLLIAIHRYARGRQLSADDRQWAIRALDALTALLADAPDSHTYGGTNCDHHQNEVR